MRWTQQAYVAIAAILGVVCVVLPSYAVAKGPSRHHRECRVALNKAHKLEANGHLREARDALVGCGKAVCGRAIQHACSVRYTRIEAEIPSIVPLATDERGMPVVDVEVSVDGQRLTSRLDGVALWVDPGLHEIAFTREGGEPVIQQVMIAQGQRNRTISVSLPAVDSVKSRSGMKEHASKEMMDKEMMDKEMMDKEMDSSAVDTDPATPANSSINPDDAAFIESVTISPSSSGPGAGTYVLAGTGVLAIIAGGLLTSWGRRDNASLSECTPFCKEESLAHIRRLYVAADISFGVGAAALATSIWLFASSFRGSDRPDPEFLGVDIQPVQSGAFASVSGRF